MNTIFIRVDSELREPAAASGRWKAKSAALRCIAVLGLVLVASVSTTSAQGTAAGVTPQFSIPLEDSYYTNLPHASTAIEGALHGWAEVIRSQAQYGMAAAQAQLYLSQARVYNTQAAIQYFQLRKANQEYQMSLRPPRFDRNRYASLGESRRPPRLPPADFNPNTGQIAWPSVLMEPEFAPLRSDIDQLLTRRAAAREITAADYQQLDETLDHLQYQLREKIRDYPTDLYIAANRFLTSLQYEAKLAPSTSPAQIGATPRIQR